MHHRPLLITAASLALAAAAPAHAVATSSATLGPLTITLFDLNPLDNIAPQVTFSDIYSGYGSYVYADAYTATPYGYDSQQNWGVNSFSPVSISAATALSGSTAAVTGTGTAAGTSMSASGFSSGTGNPNPFSYEHGSYNAQAYTPYYYYSSFTLSANTLMLISATSTLSASVSSSFDPYTSYQYEYASAYTNMQVSGPSASGSGSGSQSSSDGASMGISSAFVYDASCTYGYCYTGASSSDTRTIGVSFVNASGADMTGNMYSYAAVNGYSYAQAVPEPETYAMMLGGLLMLGFMARRRQA